MAEICQAVFNIECAAKRRSAVNVHKLRIAASSPRIFGGALRSNLESARRVQFGTYARRESCWTDLSSQLAGSISIPNKPAGEIFQIPIQLRRRRIARQLVKIATGDEHENLVRERC